MKLKLTPILIPSARKEKKQPENNNPGKKKQTTCEIPDGNRESFVPADFFLRN